MSTKIEKGTMAQRLAKIVAAGVIASAMCAPMAFASDPEGTVGASSAENASTTLNVQMLADEVSQQNANVKFTVPTAINFVAQADGTMFGPSAANATIQNNSGFPVHVSSMKVDSANGWNIVATDAVSASSDANTIGLQIGPTGAMEEISAHLTDNDKAIANDKKANWQMAKKDGATDGGKVALSTTGSLKNVDQDISSKVQFGTIQWYITPGNAPATQG